MKPGRESGLTIVEVLVTLVVFSILAVAMMETYRFSERLYSEAARLERALILAQDIYEEMRALPFQGNALPEQEGLPRPLERGSFLAYADYTDSPAVDLLGQDMPWARGLGRIIRIRRFTPQDRTRVLPPLTPPTSEYGEGMIEVREASKEEPIVRGEFVRAEVRM